MECRQRGNPYPTGAGRAAVFPLSHPGNVETDIVEYMSRYGRLVLEKVDDQLLLRSEDPLLLDQISGHKKTQRYVSARLDSTTVLIGGEYRGRLKQDLIKIGFPVQDQAGYADGTPLESRFWSAVPLRHPFICGIISVLQFPHFTGEQSWWKWCGCSALWTGKTVVGIGTMAEVKRHTLILVTNIVALHQWKREILSKNGYR